MRRLIISFVTIVGLAALVFGVTRAFFTDTEKSVGNTFTAGSLDLQIDSTSHYDGMVCTNLGTVDSPQWKWQDEDNDLANNSRPALIGQPCEGTWPAGTLTSNKFFNLTDVKPGDEGENTISFHTTNDSWLCARIDNMSVGASGPELANGLFFTAWSDPNCNNSFDQGEPLLFSNQMGPASDVLNGKTYPLADSSTPGGPLLSSNQSSCIGLRWCAGTMTISGNTITCDGAGLGNDAQGDSVAADISFHAEQSRNNPNFLCANLPAVQ